MQGGALFEGSHDSQFHGPAQGGLADQQAGQERVLVHVLTGQHPQVLPAPTSPVTTPMERSEMCQEIRATASLRDWEQTRERRKPADPWEDKGYVFAQPTGGPLIRNTDCHQWKHLLHNAGVRDGRLHDARHTAGTVLLLLGVP